DSVFQAGDQIQVSVQTNYPGYLYIVNQGSSGAWQALFPAKDIQEGDNYVERLHTYTLPSARHMMTITEPKGVENLTIVFTRQPEADFDNLIYSLKNVKSTPSTAPQATPPPDKPAPDKSKKDLLYASAAIDDVTMGRVRNKIFARDLIIEAV